MNKPKVQKVAHERLHSNIHHSFLKMSVTIYRNYADIPFAKSLTPEQRSAFEEKFIKFLIKKKKNFTISTIGKLSDSEKLSLLNRGFWVNIHASTPDMIIIFSNDIIILLNHINHLTIIGTSDNLSNKPIYKKVHAIEEKLGEFSDYLVNEHYGYISPNLESCGLSMKITALMHLALLSDEFYPSNSDEKTPTNVDFYKEDFYQRGYTIEKSFFSESSNLACYFDVSSRFNLGLSENELLERFEVGIKALIQTDEEFLLDYYRDNEQSIDDIVYRSVGTLQYARMLNMNESLTLLSQLRIGLKLGLQLPFDIKMITRFQDSLMSNEIEKYIDAQLLARDPAIAYASARAKFIRTILEEKNVQ